MKKTGHNIICKACGKEKYKALWEIKAGTSYCSKACNLTALKGNRRWDHPNAIKNQFKNGHNLTPKRGKMIDCLVCDKRFYVQEFDYNDRKYCSFRCYWKDKLTKNPSYTAIHIRMKKVLVKPKNCRRCNKATNRLDLSNNSYRYTDDIFDWEWICRACHIEKDRGNGGVAAKVFEKVGRSYGKRLLAPANELL